MNLKENKMNVIKKYTAIKLFTQNVDDDVNIILTYGSIEGPHYSRDYPEQVFDTEELATEYAYKTDKWCTWIITPVITFNNF